MANIRLILVLLQLLHRLLAVLRQFHNIIILQHAAQKFAVHLCGRIFRAAGDGTESRQEWRAERKTGTAARLVKFIKM